MKKGGQKTMSSKQLVANRNNALKSTGPKTVTGKAIAKMNALKHGILSVEVLVRGGHYKESLREFRTYRNRCWQELAPGGPLEEALVDEIVTNRWRQRRILLAESGEIALSVENGWWRRSRVNIEKDWLVWMHAGNMVTAMEESAGGVRYLRHILEGLRDAVQKEGQLTEDAFNEALDAFAKKPNSLTRKLADFRRLLQENPEKLDNSALLARHRDLVLGYLEKELRCFVWRLLTLDEREEKEEEARQAASVLPPADTLDKILRYETTLDRQFYRAMNQLERLQRIRSGEPVPPPLTMEVSQKC
jgi:hypothetical protein